VRVLFTTTAPTTMRFFEDAMAELARRGHEVHIARHLPGSKSRHDHVADRLVERFPNVTRGTVPAPDPVIQPLAMALRAARDFLQFLDPVYNPSYRLRAEKRLPAPARLVLRALAASAPLRRAVNALLDALSDAVPVDPAFTAYLAETRPDVVLMSPYMTLKTLHPDFARAVKAAGIPAVVCVASWDNLSSKSRVWPAPDLLTVWNDTQRREAAAIHGLDPNTVAVTGAQLFDQWFERRPRPREEFLARVGLPADRPVLLWVCSSPFGNAPDERPTVERWIADLRASDDPELATASVMVRPHPKRTRQWEGADLAAFGDAVVFPPLGAHVVGEEASQDYFDSLFHSAAVVGLNTSAMIEAGIVGRPVHSLLVPEFHESQDGTFHFRYLVEVGGGLLRVASTLPEHHAQLSASVAAAGEVDALAEGFVRDFVRPAGLDVPATPCFADAIERATAARPRRRRRGGALHAILRPVVIAGAHVRHRLDRAARRRRKRRRRAR
jgi:hypothetical protein